MSVTLITAGLLLGVFSSFHCIGMCGPLALSLPLGQMNGWKKTLSLTLYHAGRIGVYAALGLAFGLAGRRIYLAGFQRWFSILSGLVILGLLIQYFLFRRQVSSGWLSKYYLRLQQWIFYLWKRPSGNKFFWLGIANGLLPCGMVYLALAGALNFHEAAQSTAFMVCFGLGTLPSLMMVSYFGHLLRPELRIRMRKMIPVVMALMGIALILRGMNLGIPYVSPALETTRGAALSCH